MDKLLRISAALILIFGIASAILWWQLSAEREHTALLQAQISRSMPGTLASSSAGKESQSGGVQALLREAMNREREQLDDPELRSSRIAQIRTMLNGNHPGLAAELELSAAESDQMFDLLTKHEVWMRSNSFAPPLDRSDPAVQKEFVREQQEVVRQHEAAIAALLGRARLPKWLTYQQNAPARNRAKAIGDLLNRAGLPLNSEQLTALSGALAAQDRRERGEMAQLTRDIDLQGPVAQAQLKLAVRRSLEESNQQMLDAATRVLSDRQIAVVRAQISNQMVVVQAHGGTLGEVAPAQNPGVK